MSNNIEDLIPLLIRRIRTEKNFSQEELALKSGLDRTYISGVERGVRNITLKSLSKILIALDIDTLKFTKELDFQCQNDNKLTTYN